VAKLFVVIGEEIEALEAMGGRSWRVLLDAGWKSFPERGRCRESSPSVRSFEGTDIRPGGL